MDWKELYWDWFWPLLKCTEVSVFNNLSKIRMPRSLFIYPTNDFGHQNNVIYYYYKTYVLQGRNFTNFNVHQVEIVNNTNQPIEFVEWRLTSGRVDENFHRTEIPAGLSSVAYLVPSSYGVKRIEGAAVFRVKGQNKYYTVAFSDELTLSAKTSGVKGHIEEGNDTQRAIWSLKDDSPKTQPWGSYEFNPNSGRGRTVFTIGAKRIWSWGIYLC